MRDMGGGKRSSGVGTMAGASLMAALALQGCITADTGSEPDSVIATPAGEQLRFEQIDSFVRREMAELGMPGLSLAIIEDGEIAYDATLGVANAETGETLADDAVFEAASLSKPVFAYLFLKLVDRGLIDLDTPLYRYRPMEELEADGRYHAVTARMALSHTTGFPNWRWFDPAPPEMQIERGTMYQKREPGEFGYSGEGYNYLAEIAAQRTGHDLTSFDAVFQDEIATPLGLACSSYVRSPCVAERKVRGHRDGKLADEQWPRSFPEDTPQTFGSAGRLHTNARDYARIMIAMMNGEGLSPGLVGQMFAPQSEVPRDSTNYREGGDTAWGLGLGIEPTPYGIRYEHGGNNGDFQSGMMFFRDRKYGYVFFTNSDKGDAFNKRLETFLTEGKP